MTPLPTTAPGHTGFAVSVADVASTAAAFGRTHDVASGVARTAAAALAGSSGMAGEDGPMAAWRSRYDAVARATWAACGAAVGTLHDIAATLVETGNAYLAADHASAPGSGGDPGSLTPVGQARGVPAGPPSATGPSGGAAPAALAAFWPGGDPGRLRQAASAWAALAEGLDDAALDADRAFRTLTAHNTGQTFSAMAAFWASRYTLCAGDPLFNVAPIGARTLGQCCAALADLVEHTRTTIANAPRDAVEGAAPVQLLGSVPGPPGRVAALLGRMAGPILESEFARIARGEYLEQLDELTRRLSPDLEGRLEHAAVGQRPGAYGVSLADVGEVAGLGVGGSGWDGVPGRSPTPDSIHVPQQAAAHILDGDNRGGGHLSGAGRRNKSEFPADWDRDRIMRTALSIARDPHSRPVFQSGPKYDAWKIEEVRDQILIRVVVKTDGELVTAVPLSGPGVVRNPR